MLIDWFTVGAQALNFLILVWLMKRFLYQPILNAIDAREKKIAAALADAEAKKFEAQKERDSFNQKNEALDQERAALLSKATDQANVEGQRLLEAARTAANSLSAKRQDALHHETAELNQAITRQTQEAVFSITRKALADLATTELEERLSDIFIRRLRELDEPTKAGMGTALSTAPEPARVCSAFALPDDQRAKIQNAINETFSANIPLAFEMAPDLVSGIELTASGQKIAWSIADYLTALEKGVGELLKPKNNPQPKAKKPKPEEAKNPQVEDVSGTTLATQ
jgi:F-type H+-transporting ATPase subunit b